MSDARLPNLLSRRTHLIDEASCSMTPFHDPKIPYVLTKDIISSIQVHDDVEFGGWRLLILIIHDLDFARKSGKILVCRQPKIVSGTC